MKLSIRDKKTKMKLDALEIVDEDSGTVIANPGTDIVLSCLRRENLTLDTDLYELTMSAGYRILGRGERTACFDLYYRQNPDDGGFCVFAGLESAISYINNLAIYPDDIEYLSGTGIFSTEALKAIGVGVNFTGDVWAVPEGTIVFPNEPLIRIVGPISEAQILETTLLALVGHQTLIATKAARLCIAAKNAPVVDFGTRRAHGIQAALYGARAAYIGGCDGTSNVKAGKLFGIPVRGTHAHSWVESFEHEVDSFRGFSDVFPDNCVLLVDTYDTVEGIKNAIQVGIELRQRGKNLNGIRIDSGDLAYYSKIARQMLNEAGFNQTRILASSDLDEWLIESLKQQGAEIDIWCVGTRLMTSYQTPALGVVYKLMAVDHGDGKIVPRIKISHNPNKVTNPGVKKIVRFYNGGNRMIGDLLTQVDEPVPHSRPVMAHHPMYDYMKKVYRPPFRAKELMVPIFLKGKQVYKCPPLIDVRNRAIEQLDSLEPEFKRFSNPHIYKVSLSEKLYRVKKNLLSFHRGKLKSEKRES
ncbi:MAG: nicotinate phosphoribosyltransferase [Deltaproteobacteria bacterium]|nr:nicotinate phosphoribosyltransferase [Deltaproteobacteria bacterium]